MKSIGLASLKGGSKFTIVALFYFVFLGQLSKYKPPGGLYLEGQFNGGFFGLPVWGLIFGEAYFWNFTVYLAFLIFSIHSSVSFVDFPFK